MSTQQDAFLAMDELAYACGKPQTTAVLKQSFSDFIVDEELGFSPSGSGEHLFVRLRKKDMGTTEVARLLAETARISSRDVGYSGMKDRRGECSQWFSIKLPPGQQDETRAALQALESEQIQLLDQQRNARKLRIGSHRANRFKLLLRDCEGEQDAFEQRLRQLAVTGMPNYFGPQRFGRELSNLHQVQALFAQDQRDQEAGEATKKPAAQKNRQRRQGMLYSAARSYLFNQILSLRVAAENWNQYVAGDVLNLEGTDRYFAVALGDWDATLQGRLQEADIHPTGLLPGVIKAQDRYLTVSEAADIEDAVCGKYPQLLAGLRARRVDAGRRALRCMVGDLRWNWPEPQQLLIEFTLPRGAYATSLLREICELREAD